MKYIIGGAVLLLVIALIAWMLQRSRKPRANAAPSPRPSAPTSSAAPPQPRARRGAQAAPLASPGSQATRTNWLIGRRGAVTGKTFHIGERTVTIGRGVSNFVQVVDDRVSRVHCQLSPVEGSLRVKDLNSTVGVLINGEPVKEAVLQNGDQLQIGDTILEFWYQGEFDRNAALEKKESGAEARMATQSVDLVGNLKQTAARALHQHNGDVKAAAASLGVSPEFFLRVLNE